MQIQVKREMMHWARLLDTPWKIAVVCTIASLLITYILALYFAGAVPYYVPFIVVACAFPLAYLTSRLMASHHKVAEEQNVRLQKLTAELSDAIRQLNVRNRELEQLVQELQISNEELDAFARTVAHDLKNPLTTVVSYQEMLVRFGDEMPREKLLDIVQKARRAGYKTVHIVDALLLLARVRQREQIPLHQIQMADIIGEVQQRMEAMIREYDAEILLPAAWPVALGYAPWVEEVWANYISNGLKYGGRPPRLSLGGEIQPDGMVRFWVLDNGHGFIPGHSADLFREFTRQDQNGIDGYGLGLSISKRIVGKLGGEVGVEHQTGGSLFYFTLPMPDRDRIDRG